MKNLIKQKNIHPSQDLKPEVRVVKLRGSSRWARNSLILGFIVIVGLIVYSNTWDVPFQFDDTNQILSNWSIHNLTISTLPKIWISNVKTRFLPYLSFAVNWTLDGKNVTGYHVFNFGVHALNAFLVFSLISLILLTPKMRGIYTQKTAFYLSVFSALIFAVHPLQTQAVTYIVQRMTSMAAFFYLGAVVLYLRARSGSGIFYYVGAVGMAIGAMFCKENAITLPLVIMMVDLLFFDQRDGKWKALLRWMPFLATTLLALYCNDATRGLFHLLDRKEGITIRDIIPVESERALPRGKYFLTELNVLCTYLRLLFVPVNQNLDYDYPTASSFLEPKTLACGLMLLGLLATGVAFLKRNRLVSFSIFWFFLTLSVESSILPIVDVIFEHRMYLPLAGCAVILPLAILFILENLSHSVIVGVIVVAIFSGMAHARNYVWRSKYSLWEDVIKKAPNKPRGYNNLGYLCTMEGRHKEARSFYETAIAKDPNFPYSYLNLGVELEAIGKRDEAQAMYEKAISLDPKYLEPRNNLAILYGERGELDRTIEMFQEIIKIAPDYTPAYDNLGVSYDKMGNFPKAIESFQKATEVNPYYAPASFHLGLVLGETGDLDGAISHLKRSIELDPEYPDPVQELGKVYLRKGDKEKAKEQIQRLKDMRFSKLAQELEDLLARGWGTGVREKGPRIMSFGPDFVGSGEEMSEKDKKMMKTMRQVRRAEDARRIQAISNLPKVYKISPSYPVVRPVGMSFVKETVQQVDAGKDA